MPKIDLAEPGTICIIIQDPNGRVCQLATTLGEVFIKYLEKGYIMEFNVHCPFHFTSFNPDYTSEEIEWMNWWIDTKCPK